MEPLARKPVIGTAQITHAYKLNQCLTGSSVDHYADKTTQKATRYYRVHQSVPLPEALQSIHAFKANRLDTDKATQCHSWPLKANCHLCATKVKVLW